MARVRLCFNYRVEAAEAGLDIHPRKRKQSAQLRMHRLITEYLLQERYREIVMDYIS